MFKDNNWWNVAVACMLAAFGGFVATVAGKPKGERYSLWIALPEIIIAVFAGVLVHHVCIEMSLSTNMSVIAVALTGYSARSILTILNGTLIHWLRVVSSNVKETHVDKEKFTGHDDEK